MKYKLENTNKMNAPTFAHYTGTGRYKFISGRAMSHPDRKICGDNNCAMIDNKIPEKPMKILLSLKEIEMRSSCQGSKYHGPFFIFRPTKLNTDKYCELLCKNIDNKDEIICRYGEGRSGQNRIIVTKIVDSKLENNIWWNKAVNKILEFFNKKTFNSMESCNSSSGFGSTHSTRNKPNLTYNYQTKSVYMEDKEIITAKEINKEECNLVDMVKNPKLRMNSKKGKMQIEYFDTNLKEPLIVYFVKDGDKWKYRKINKNQEIKFKKLLNKLTKLNNFIENTETELLLTSKATKKLFIKNSKQLNSEILKTNRIIENSIENIFMKKDIKNNAKTVKNNLIKMSKMKKHKERMKELANKLNADNNIKGLFKGMDDSSIKTIKKIIKNKQRIKGVLANEYRHCRLQNI